LYDLTMAAVLELGLGPTAVVAKVEKIEDIMNYGVMMTPALAIDGTVVVSGRVPTKDEIKKWISGKKA
jgi:predicted thioredoxin/glutaredoxin